MQILVPPEHLEQVAHEFRQAGKTTQELVSRLSQAIGHLEMGWSGTTQTNFYTMFQEAHHHLNAASENMLSTHKELTTIAQRFRTADEEQDKELAANISHRVPTSSDPVGPFQARTNFEVGGDDPFEGIQKYTGPPPAGLIDAADVVNKYGGKVMNFIFGTTDMKNEWNTVFHSNASVGTKILGGSEFLGNAVLDLSMIFGIGEIAKGVWLSVKGIRLLRIGSVLPKIISRGGKAFKFSGYAANLVRVDRILKAMQQFREVFKIGNGTHVSIGKSFWEFIKSGMIIPQKGLQLAYDGGGILGTVLKETGKDDSYITKFKNLFKDEGSGEVSSLGKLSANELKSVGSPAENSGIRSVKGNSSDAFKFFKNQVNPSTIREAKPGVYVGNDGEGITFTYRAASKSGPPTIDVNGVQGLRKIKFIN